MTDEGTRLIRDDTIRVDKGGEGTEENPASFAPVRRAIIQQLPRRSR